MFARAVRLPLAPLLFAALASCTSSTVVQGGDGGGDLAVPDMATSCGNGICGADENCTTCAADCGPCAGCGDGVCQPSENCQSCPEDCFVCPACGDGYCKGGETCASCAPDCGACPGCGNGKCEMPREDCFSCPKDCGACVGCGDGKCLAPETCNSCPMDCGVCSVCGNMKCEPPYETCVNCPGDCGQCATIGCLEMLTCSLSCIDLAAKPPKVSISCVSDCGAMGCASAQYFFDQAFNCLVDAALGGKCMGPNIGCLMMQCQGAVASCTGSVCK